MNVKIYKEIVFDASLKNLGLKSKVFEKYFILNDELYLVDSKQVTKDEKNNLYIKYKDLYEKRIKEDPNTEKIYGDWNSSKKISSEEISIEDLSKRLKSGLISNSELIYDLNQRQRIIEHNNYLYSILDWLNKYINID